MPFITRKSLEELRFAGNLMSNICFNLSQLGAKDAVTMNEAYQRWDKATATVQNEIATRMAKRMSSKWRQPASTVL